MNRYTMAAALGLLACLALTPSCTKPATPAKSGSQDSARQQRSADRSDADGRAARSASGEGGSATSATRVAVDSQIAAACKLRNPRFDFDSAQLRPEAKEALAALIRCLTSGPLVGRKLKLVGHADPRGETYYNYGLGQRRAGKVARYLSQHGLATGRMHTSSRGELDASGADEPGWARDRRVDVSLAQN